MSLPIDRRALLLGAAGLVIARMAAAQAPAAYPTRPIVAVVPQAPGGAADSAARLVMQQLATELGQPVVIDNRVGAGGMIGTRFVAKAPRDGYTLLFTSTSHVINATLHRQAGYDALHDFTPIALVARGPFVLVANPDFEAKTTAELIALAKRMPGKIDYGSVGVGSFNHLLGEMLNAEAGIQLQHVPYKGSSEAAAAVVGNQIPLAFNSLPGVLPFIKAGKLRALGVTTPTASPLAPDIPPLAAQVPGYEGTSWEALLAPAGVPAQVAERLAGGVQKAVLQLDPARLASQGIQLAYGGPDELQALLVAQQALWSRVIRQGSVSIVD